MSASAVELQAKGVGRPARLIDTDEAAGTTERGVVPRNGRRATCRLATLTIELGLIAGTAAAILMFGHIARTPVASSPVPPSPSDPAEWLSEYLTNISGEWRLRSSVLNPRTPAIRAADRRVRVVGRSAITPLGIAFDFPGVRISGFFSGTSVVTATLSQAGHASRGTVSPGSAQHFVVLVDGQERDGRGHAAFSTRDWPLHECREVTLASGLDPTATHEIELVKSSEGQHDWPPVGRWEPNYVTLHGFDGDEMLAIVDPEPRDVRSGRPEPAQQRRIEFLGDSVTAGYCNLCEEIAPRDAIDRSVDSQRSLYEYAIAVSSYVRSWAYLTCETLGAECHTAAASGRGVAFNWRGERWGETLMPDLWRRTLATVGSSDRSDVHGTLPSNRWDFGSWVPHALVINLGTNDEAFALDKIQYNKARRGVDPFKVRPDIADAFKSTLLALVMNASSEYGPDTHVFLLCGPMNFFHCARVSWVAQEASRAGVRAHDLLLPSVPHACCDHLPGERITGTGHPSAHDDEILAEAVTSFIREKMGW